MTLTSPSPTLPPELERQIFELYAISRPLSIPRLILVAQRVKEWVEPLLYRTMALNWTSSIPNFPVFRVDNIVRAIRTKPLSFFHTGVRHLRITPDYTDEHAEILAVCTGVENLALWHVPDAWIPLIESYPLKRLDGQCIPLLMTLAPTHRLFSRLTHLILRDSLPYGDFTWATLAALPQLTHMAFFDWDFIPMCPQILEFCMTLRVLICANPDAVRLGHQEYGDILARDVRFVLMNLEFSVADWHKGARGRKDCWSRAENIIARRRTGEIDPLQYAIGI
ncbi:hypothetical protein B0H19DRAFT_1124474 [Mycena capillaripes]|nr:hypothetical protein B0H19DRAFT_1124474 [Mycena capillaripes]